jgi:hypothetical protein
MTVINARYANWHAEDLQEFYGDDNNGLIHGVYVYEDDEDFPAYVEWFKTEEEAREALLKL